MPPKVGGEVKFSWANREEWSHSCKKCVCHVRHSSTLTQGTWYHHLVWRQRMTSLGIACWWWKCKWCGCGVHKIKHICPHSCFPQCCNQKQHFGQNVHRLQPVHGSVHGPAHAVQTLGQCGLYLFSAAAITNYHVFSGVKQHSFIISQSYGLEVQVNIA